MACRVLFDFWLKLLNLILGIVGLAMIGYGIYLLIEWIKIASEGNNDSISPAPYNEGLAIASPLLRAFSFDNGISDQLSKAWFIYLFIGIGLILFIMSCFGCIGAATRNRCCLSFYSFLVILLILVELAFAGFIFLDHSWKKVIPADKTGDFDMIYNFLRENWKIAKWVAFGAVVLEALAFMIALAVRAANEPSDDEDDEEYMIGQRGGARQPLIDRQSEVPTLEHRPIRNDAWSQRMRDKYGIDVLNFSDPTRFHQGTINQGETKSRCIIL